MTHPILNRPEVQMVLFHPRREPPGYGMPDVHRISVEVGQGVSIGGRLYPARPESPAILYFHGNGEIAADYDDLTGLGPLFQASMLFFALIVFLFLQPLLTTAPFALADTVVIFIMGLVCFIPFAFFVRGVASKEKYGEN